MADSTKTRVSVIREVTAGTTPATPALQQLRFNSSNLVSNITTVTSDEIDDTRNVSDLVLVGQENSGDMTAELSYISHDALIAGAMSNDWTAYAEISNKTADENITAVSGANTIEVGANGTDFSADDVIRLMGFDNAANNGLFVVASSTATTVVVVGTLVNQTSVQAGARVKKVGVEAATADVVAAVSPNRLTSTLLNFTTLGLVVGSWIKIGGAATANQFATTANNGFCRVTSIAAGEIQFDIVPTGFAADTGTGKDIRLFLGDYVRNGTSVFSHTFEQVYFDTNPVVHQYFRGVQVGGMSVNMDAQSIAMIDFSFMGLSSEYMEDTTIAGQTYWKDTLTEVLNTSSNVARIAENGTAVVGPNFVMSATIELNNNLRGRPAIGSVGYVSIGQGRCLVTGTLNTYFGNAALAKKVLTNEDTGLDFVVKGDDGAAILIDMPRVKFSSGTTPITGIDTDVMLDLGYQAVLHSTFGYTIHMQRFGATE